MIIILIGEEHHEISEARLKILQKLLLPETSINFKIKIGTSTLKKSMLYVFNLYRYTNVVNFFENRLDSQQSFI